MPGRSSITADEIERRGVIAMVQNRCLDLALDPEFRHPAAYLRHDPGLGLYCFVAKGQTAFNRDYVIDHRLEFHMVSPSSGNGLRHLTAFFRTPVVLPAEDFVAAEHGFPVGRLLTDEYDSLLRSMRWNLILRGA